jgi:hypothetical protein
MFKNLFVIFLTLLNYGIGRSLSWDDINLGEVAFWFLILSNFINFYLLKNLAYLIGNYRWGLYWVMIPLAIGLLLQMIGGTNAQDGILIMIYSMLLLCWIALGIHHGELPQPPGGKNYNP